MQTRNSADTALGFALAGLVIAFVVSLTWVAQLSDWLRSLQIVSFVIAVYVVSTIMQTRAERRMDEVELAAARFGARW
jgi:undecaprenyl pyrophosphate phosphatase UppP